MRGGAGSALHVALVLAGLASVAAADARIARAQGLTASVRSGRIRVGPLARTYLLYVPAAPAATPALVVALHGAPGDGAEFRGYVGDTLEDAADEHGFLVAYPDGYEQHWNDCRGKATFAANRLGIDDVGFLRDLVATLQREHGVDPARVYALGFSNGAHMAYRLAIEAPDLVAAAAAVAANLTVDDELDCATTGEPVAMMIVNGTADPLNHYAGGVVTGPDGSPRGRVRSAEDTAAYFAALSGHVGAPAVRAMRRADGSGDPDVELRSWSAPSLPEVVLYGVRGGRHTIPGSPALPRSATEAERRFDAVAEAVRFFLRQPARYDVPRSGEPRRRAGGA